MSMHMLRTGRLPLPEVVVVTTDSDVAEAKRLGLPYIKTKLSDAKIVGYIMLPVLERRMPGIAWRKVLGLQGIGHVNVVVPVKGGFCEVDGVIDSLPDGNADTVSDMAEGERLFSGGREDMLPEDAEVDASVLLVESDWSVDMDALAELGMLPHFLSDVTEAVRRNLTGRDWTEGYNKKRGWCAGNFVSGEDCPNLLIVDVSASIPESVSATMISLLDTLRSKADAHLIVTGATSMYWAPGEKLPSPEWIRAHIPRSNEEKMFSQILRDHVLGKHWGNVVSFGDYDTPYLVFDEDRLTPAYRRTYPEKSLDKCPGYADTKVDAVWNYHTRVETWTGYAKWVKDLPGCHPELHFDCSWAKEVKRG